MLVNLKTSADQLRAVNKSLDLKLVISKYLQPFGVFSGHVTTVSGERLELDSLPGVTEDHTARW